MFPRAVYALFIDKERKGTKAPRIQGHMESSSTNIQGRDRKTVWFTEKSPGMELHRRSSHQNSTTC